MENAVAHTGGSAKVVIATDGHYFQITLPISDNGEGIPNPYRSVITRETAFTQLTHSQGLGLWFVRWVMDTYGGTFELKSVDSGTTVAVGVLRAVD